MEKIAEEKQARLTEVLGKGAAMIHLDARRPGVLVPGSLKADFHLRLNLSYRYDPPDLSVGDWGVRETLSFGQAGFACAVPWSAIFAISNREKVWVFPRDIPDEMLGDFAKAAEVERVEREATALRVVTPVESPALETVGSAARPKLRLIKND
jgi:hypothetical protein